MIAAIAKNIDITRSAQAGMSPRHYSERARSPRDVIDDDRAGLSGCVALCKLPAQALRPTGANMLQNRIATMLAVFTLTFLYSAIPANAAAKPKIRALTAFIRIDPAKYREQIGHTLEFLRRAKAEFARAGYEVETIRLTTQPFGEYIRGAKREEALQLFHDLNDLTTRNSLLVNIGPVSTAVDVALAGDILASNTNLNSSMMVTDQRAIDWDAVRKA